MCRHDKLHLPHLKERLSLVAAVTQTNANFNERLPEKWQPKRKTSAVAKTKVLILVGMIGRREEQGYDT